MPRKILIRSAVHPYHLTGRSNNREAFHCGPEVAWSIFCLHLQEIEELFGVKIHSFVLMPNHFHLLMSSPNESVDVVMHRLMWSVTKSINLKSARIGRVFGGRYHWSLVNSLNYFDYVLKYIYRNPVKAGLVALVEDYSFSTLRAVLGLEKLPFALHAVEADYPLIPGNQPREFLKWLNQAFQIEQDRAIQLGLRKTTFHPAKSGWQKRPNHLLSIRA